MNRSTFGWSAYGAPRPGQQAGPADAPAGATSVPEPSEDGLSAFLAAFHQLSEAAATQAQAGRACGEPLVPPLEDHLGTDPRALPVLTELLTPLREVDADVALEHVVAAHGGGTLLGVGGGEQRWHHGLSELLQMAGSYDMFRLGPVEYRSTPVGPDEERSAVAFGLHLFHHGEAREPVVVLQRLGNARFGQPPQLEVMAAADGVAAAVLAEIRETMTARSVLRGQVVTFTGSEYGSSAGGITFVRRPDVPARDVILPPGRLGRIERHVLGIAEHRAELAAAGQHLKRGVLLYGPPGTGKTHTVRYLVGAAREATVVLLSGMSLQLVSQAAEVARALQPALVVLEDCDLVAEERSHRSASPLLFEVLDALDGLASDADVVFLLTTNRADVLEPALAQRPGRVDLAVEIPLPGPAARAALLDLYAGRLPFSDEVREEVAAATAGTTASFTKEVVRRAVLAAVERGTDVGDEDLRAAMAEMMADGGALTRVLLGGAGDQVDGPEGRDGYDVRYD